MSTTYQLPANIATIRALIAEDKALVDRHIESMSGYRNVLIRRWEKIEDEHRHACIEYLKRWGSANSKQATITLSEDEIGKNALAQLSEDPKASLYPRPGVWFIGPVEEQRRQDGDGVDIVQTLFRGSTGEYLTQMVSQNCEFEVTRKLYLNSTTRPQIPDTRPAGTSYKISEIMVDDQTGAFTGWLDTIVRKYRDLGPYTETSDAFEVITVREQDGLTDAVTPDPPTPNAASPASGTIITQDQELHDDCSKRVRSKTMTPQEVDDYIKQKTIEYFQTVDVLEEKNQDAALTEQSSQTEGTIKTTESQKTRVAGKFDCKTTTRTATKREWSYTFTSRYGTVYVWIGRNVTEAEKTTAFTTASLTDATDNDGTRWEWNDFGKIDYFIIKRPYFDSETFTDTMWEGLGEDVLFKPTVPLKDSSGRRYYVYMLRTSSYLKAYRYRTGTSIGGDGVTYGAVTSGYTVTGSYGAHTTGIYKRGPGRWMAVRVELNDSDFWP